MLRSPASERSPSFIRFLRSLVLVLLLCSFEVAPALTQQLTPTSVEFSVPEPPRPVRALGRFHLVYEVHLTNFGQDSLWIEQLQTSTADEPASLLSSSDARELAGALLRVGQAPQQAWGAAILSPGARGVVYQWIALDPGREPPRELRHTLKLHATGAGQSDTLRPPAVPVSSASPRTIGRPVEEGRWVAIRAPSNASGHRRSIATLGGRARVPERFAVDWARLGEDGRLFQHDPEANANWYGYDRTVLAVDSGTVVRLRDGLPDHEPLSALVSSQTFTPETAPGNTVVLDLGHGVYAVYAHLRPGSIMVEIGDRVQAGEVLGRIGNSGHSLAPHLHFHLQNTPDPLLGEGHPFHLAEFELLGRVDSVPAALRGEPWTPQGSRPPRRVTDEIPLENMVMSFP